MSDITWTCDVCKNRLWREELTSTMIDWYTIDHIENKLRLRGWRIDAKGHAVCPDCVKASRASAEEMT